MGGPTGELEVLGEILKLVGKLLVLLARGLWWLARAVARKLRPNKLPAERGTIARVEEPRADARKRPSSDARKRPSNDDARARLVRTLADLERRATAMATTAKLERPNRRFRHALTEFFPDELGRVRVEVRARGELRPGAIRAVAALGGVLDEIEALMEQRRDPTLRDELGDADRLAEACYQPVIDFAVAKDLPLTSNFPATQLGDFDLGIWTGFIPTSIAPIFLPRDFFARAAWWPAVAHEIGHDFLASVRGLEPRLRDELGLPSEDEGTRPIAVTRYGIESGSVERFFGGWFEELFCDVFGTMMCGPGYVTTMTQLFAATDDVREVLLVGVDRRGRYDIHPPRHLRVLAGCAVLERAGLHTDAKRLRAAWEATHTAERGPDRLLFPVAGSRLVAVPLDAFVPRMTELVERLYAGPLDALGGFGLESISGLDYGPHEHAEGLRARDALLRGATPAVRDPRALVTGAVLAATARPELELRILEHARAAIPAAGTSERRPDAYSTVATAATAPTVDRDTLVDALVLREVLGKPRALSRRR